MSTEAAARSPAPRQPLASPGASEGPIVIASNRLPFTVHRTGSGLERTASSGGLVSALEPVLRSRGGTWIGWPGLDLQPGEEWPEGDEPYRVAPVDLEATEIEGYLHGFSNRALWPLLHSLSFLPSYDREDFERYEEVNRRFAESVLRESQPEELIWIHDYHLMLVPSMIREARPDARLAFFLHVPFPPFDVFRLLPWDREILRGLLACDLIGFHVRRYGLNFLDCVEQRLGSRVDTAAMTVEHANRAIRVGAFPIGIEYGEFETRALEAPPQPETQLERVVLGVDRLDYTKGIGQRIAAFERLLELHPEHRERVVLLQLAVPSRSEVAEYRDLKAEIDGRVGQVNGRFATARWSPIRYLYRSIPPERLAALYRDAEVALVTPLRDGMNLVAKEYVASQVKDPGVLVLSQLAGAAETMRECLFVNPYDIEATAETIHRALTMDEAERRSRMTALQRRETRDDLQSWVGSFLSAADAQRATPSPLSKEDFQAWLGPYLTRPHLAIFLDYDGTLTPLQRHPAEATLSSAMRAVIERCAERPDTDVAIVSGRSLGDVRKMMDLPDLTYAGNHGLEIEGAGIAEFQHEDLVHYSHRTPALVEALEEVSVDGAWTEAKGPTLTYHYRGVPTERWPGLVERAREIISAAGFQFRDAHAAVEARPPIGWDKGRAVLHILRERYGPGWAEDVRVVYAGDDQTDEDAFRFLEGLAMTFRVGDSDTLTAAARRLPDVSAVLALLEWLGGRDVRDGL